MRILLIILLFLFCLQAKSQDQKLDWSTIDTFYLKQLNAKKIVIYKLSSVSVYVNYKDFLKDLESIWKVYKRGMSSFSEGGYVNPEYEPRWRVIDSMYKTVKSISKKHDTIYVYQKTFDKVGLRPLMEFDVQIEKGNCLIFDNNNNQPIIIRQTGKWQRGPLQGWGGRRYYLPGKSTYFYEKSDWHS